MATGTMELDKKTYRLENTQTISQVALIIGIFGLAISAAGFFVDRERFFHAYLTAFTFWTSFGIGALFMVLLHHTIGAVWSVVVRRITETAAMTLPFMLLFFIPIIFGMHDLFHWSHVDAVAHDAILTKKASFLNIPFFLVRTVIYFAVWSLLAFLLYRSSLTQDSGHKAEFVHTFRSTSAPGLVAFAITCTFAGFDWLMSLDPHWFSTIFGVYFFAGSIMAYMAFLTVLVIGLNSQGILTTEINNERYHDIGKLLFAFLILWGYMAFSQYFLIWYANLPEETGWFLDRWTGSWKVVSYLLVFGYFSIPFLLLMGRTAKRSPGLMRIMGIWLLAMHYVDHYWIVMPNNQPESAVPSWIDPGTVMFIGGFAFYLFWRRFTAHAVIPLNDPRLKESIELVSN